ncbi:MAG: hypothetical protein LQ351_005275 [Letrouitia transgressa]|nr:MAG: hypothetical protein LQ351_005275 [Letrouitia transgressa]
MATQGEPDISIFQQLESYPWSADDEFQTGFHAILESNPDSSQDENLTLRARCFYYSRKHNIPIDFDAYRSWRSQQSLTPVINGNNSGLPSQLADRSSPDATWRPVSETSAPYPTSFSQIVELITKGEPIPGIKEIPDTLLKGQESVPTAAKRMKPWEKDHAERQTPRSTLLDPTETV